MEKSVWFLPKKYLFIITNSRVSKTYVPNAKSIQLVLVEICYVLKKYVWEWSSIKKMAPKTGTVPTFLWRVSQLCVEYFSERLKSL